MHLTHADFFAGIGGFSLAARWAGWKTVLHCEREDFCQHVLSYWFPGVELFKDIKDGKFEQYRGLVDVCTGGFPCQPFSNASSGRKGTDDDRYLWPPQFAAIQQIRPRWFVGENVRGIINWSKGLVFEQVCSDLESEGYQVQSFLLPAVAVNAPHRRDRIFFVAYASDGGRKEQHTSTITGIQQEGIHRNIAECDATLWNTAWDADKSKFLQFYDGLPHWMDNKAIRRGSIHAFGNAVVPELVLQIFKTINEYEISRTKDMA